MKKTFKTKLTAAMLAMSAATAAFADNVSAFTEVMSAVYGPPPASVVNPGDVNGDGKVHMSDVVLLSRYVNEEPVSIPLEGWKNADVTGDGELNSDDVTAILQYIARLITKFPIEGDIIVEYPKGDINHNRMLDLDDWTSLLEAYRDSTAETNVMSDTDLNQDKALTYEDLFVMMELLQDAGYTYDAVDSILNTYIGENPEKFQAFIPQPTYGVMPAEEDI